MIAPCLMALALVGVAPDADIPVLVARLGADRFAEREEAAEALAKLGRRALPELRKASESPDPEVRARASALVDKIDSELLTRPTMVTLAYRDRPLDEVVRALGEQAGVTFLMEPQNDALWKDRAVTLEAPEPVTFWEAMDRLGRAGGVQHFAAGGMGRAGGGGPALRLLPGAPPSPPSYDSGPFRVSLVSLHLHRDLTLGGVMHGASVPPPPRPAARGRLAPGERRVLPAVPSPAPSPAGPQLSEQFFVQMQVQAEPRILLIQGQELKLEEAVDDRGQSLLPTAGPGGGPAARPAVFSGVMGGPFVQMPVQLRRPEHPGDRIKTLRGALPASIASRKPDPIVVPLRREALGHPVRGDDASVTVLDVKEDPNTHHTTIDLTVRATAEAGDAVGDPGPAGLAVHQAANQLDVLDDRGNPLRGFPNPTAFQSGEVRLTMTLLPGGDAGPPAQLRYYGLSHAATEVRFEFHDIPMP